MTSILHDVVFATRDALIGELGEARAAELRAAGAICPVDDIVLRTRRALLSPRVTVAADQGADTATRARASWSR